MRGLYVFVAAIVVALGLAAGMQPAVAAGPFTYSFAFSFNSNGSVFYGPSDATVVYDTTLYGPVFYWTAYQKTKKGNPTIYVAQKLSATSNYNVQTHFQGSPLVGPTSIDGNLGQTYIADPDAFSGRGAIFVSTKPTLGPVTSISYIPSSVGFKPTALALFGNYLLFTSKPKGSQFYALYAFNASIAGTTIGGFNYIYVTDARNAQLVDVRVIKTTGVSPVSDIPTLQTATFNNGPAGVAVSRNSSNVLVSSIFGTAGINVISASAGVSTFYATGATGGGSYPGNGGLHRAQSNYDYFAQVTYRDANLAATVWGLSMA